MATNSRSTGATRTHRYLVAVSGGVDSVVLLHVLAMAGIGELIVAHVDHGIREDSGDDARFVAALAEQYGLKYVSTELKLGADASEEAARQARYEFLRQQARDKDAYIVTAHHGDDVVETIAINLLRGTGWRGLAVFGAQDIYRPMTGWRKHEVLEYALHHGLEWCEDSTNAQAVYLRNRVRRKLAALSDETNRQLRELWLQQQEVADAIFSEASHVATTDRYPYIMLPEPEAGEVLRATLGISLTRPQVRRALLAIKTAKPGSTHRLNGHNILRFKRRNFVPLSTKK